MSLAPLIARSEYGTHAVATPLLGRFKGTQIGSRRLGSLRTAPTSSLAQAHRYVRGTYNISEFEFRLFHTATVPVPSNVLFGKLFPRPLFIAGYLPIFLEAVPTAYFETEVYVRAPRATRAFFFLLNYCLRGIAYTRHHFSKLDNRDPVPANLRVTVCIADGIRHAIQHGNVVSQCTLLSRQAGARTDSVLTD